MPISLKDFQGALVASAKNISASWSDVTDVMNLGGTMSINLWVKYVANTSVDTQFRLVGMLTPDATDLYDIPIEDVTTALVNLDAEEKVIGEANQNVIIGFSLGGGVPFGKIQVKHASAVGTVGSITTAYITIGKD